MNISIFLPKLIFDQRRLSLSNLGQDFLSLLEFSDRSSSVELPDLLIEGLKRSRLAEIVEAFFLIEFLLEFFCSEFLLESLL